MTTTNRILLKKSSVVGRAPQTEDVEFGELALNFADGRLYFKNANNIVDFFESNQKIDEKLTPNLLPFRSTNDGSLGSVATIEATEYNINLGSITEGKSFAYNFGETTEATIAGDDGIDGGTF